MIYFTGFKMRKTSEKKKAEFDDVFSHVQEFGCYQKVVYFGSCLLILPIGWQIASLVFAMGSPNFHCSSGDNSTCPPNKCCDNCTSYTFDGPFTSIVSEVCNNTQSIVDFMWLGYLC